MTKRYKHLTSEDRTRIDALRRVGTSGKKIAEIVGCHPSTISRELRRNAAPDRSYDGSRAQQRAQDRSSKANSRPQPETQEIWQRFQDYLTAPGLDRRLRSPERFHGRESMVAGLNTLSRSWLYALIARDRSHGGELFRFLPRPGKAYVSKVDRAASSSRIPNRVDISERPAAVEARTTFGHWEMDTIIGRKHQWVLLTAVERLSRFMVMTLLPSKEALMVNMGILHKLLPEQQWVQTITVDNGLEFAAHAQAAKRLNTQFFFCKPYSSWPRGAIEPINGLVRRIYPKGTSFADLNETEILQLQHELNNLPRAGLGFRTPKEAYEKYSAQTP